jgi:TetR/AcrR family transcriptional regulator, regulator of cefoperazone and chloramphenicol sensitivity
MESAVNMSTGKINQLSETKQLILQATLQLLETQGLGQVTVRKIASEAGVNVAAVNYHFGSKDQVIYEALQILRGHFGIAFEHLQSTSLPPHERLVKFMTAYCDTVFAYPNLVKAFVNQSLNADIQQDYSSFVRTEGLALITQTINEILPLDNETLRMKAFQMMSSLVLILLVGQDTAPVIGLDFTDRDVRARYIQTIMPA